MVQILREQNSIAGTGTEVDDRLISIGQKTIEGYGVADIYLAVENDDPSEFLARCRSLQRPHNVKHVVVLTPLPVSITYSHRELLDARGILVISLLTAAASRKLVVDWEQHLLGAGSSRPPEVYLDRVVFLGREYRLESNIEFTKQEMRFMAIALELEEIPLSSIVHRGKRAIWSQPFRKDDQNLRDRVSQVLSRLNRGLHVRAGDPLFDPPPLVVRTVRLSEAGPSCRNAANADYALKREQIAFQRELAAIDTGVIDVIKVHDGLPVGLDIHEQP